MNVFLITALERLAAIHNVNINRLLSTSQEDPFIRARAQFVYLLHNEYKYSYPQLGKLFNRNHATMINAAKQHNVFMLQTNDAGLTYKDRYQKLCSIVAFTASKTEIVNIYDIIAKAESIRDELKTVIELYKEATKDTVPKKVELADVA